jgi:hypothetical protein
VISNTNRVFSIKNRLKCLAITFLHERKMGAQATFVPDNKRISKGVLLHKKTGKL